MQDKIVKQKVSTLAAAAIEKLIADEKLGPGSKLPSEPEMARRFGISRPSVREAIRIMEITGKLRAEQGRGVFVTDPENVDTFSSFSTWMSHHKELLCEQFEVRLLIEPHGAYRAAQNSTAPFIAELRRLYERYEQCRNVNDLPGMVSADSQLHLEIAVQSGNKTLSALMKTFSTKLNEGWISSLLTPGRSTATLKEHADLIDMLEKKDARGASQAVRSHLERAIADLGLSVTNTESFCSCCEKREKQI